MRWMRREAVCEGFAALENPEDILHQRPEAASHGQLADNRKRAVQRNSGVEQSRYLLREKENIAPLAAVERRQPQLDSALLLLLPNEDGNQPLPPQLGRGEFIALGGKRARAGFTVCGHRSKMECRRHSNWRAGFSHAQAARLKPLAGSSPPS